jgi:hypothetical protein
MDADGEEATEETIRNSAISSATICVICGLFSKIGGAE